MAASRESLLALCLIVLALPFCASKISQPAEPATLRDPNIQASNGRRLLQAISRVRPVFVGDADGGLTLATLAESSDGQVVVSTRTTWAWDLGSQSVNAFASNIAQTGCAVLQANSTGSSATSYVLFQNLTYIQPPNAYEAKDNKTRVLIQDFSKYQVGPIQYVGQPASIWKFQYPYEIMPLISNIDTVTRTFNVSATFRPVGKACSSATFQNDGQQASPVVLWAVGGDVLNQTGGVMRTLQVANATCISIKLDVTNAPTKDQLNATVNLNISAYAKLGVPGPLLNQTLVTLQQSFAASNTTTSYSGSRNDLDPGTIYVITTSGSGPTNNAVRLSVRVAILTQKGADCGAQLTRDLSLAQPASLGK